MHTDINILAKKVFTIINKIIFFEKKSIFFGNDVSLYPSEIHFLIVASEQKSNASVIANKLGLTKGAVSQTIKRLENKKIIDTVKDPNNKNEMTIILTDKGEKLFNKYRQKQSMSNIKLTHYFSSISSTEYKAIDNFLKILEEIFIIKE
jgi:DNA-binding MarR family transcriptional regulator